MPTPLEIVEEIHAKTMSKHEIHMRRYNRMFVAFLAFSALLVLSSILVLSSPELFGAPTMRVPAESTFLIAIVAFMGASLIGIIAWQQWRMTRMTRLTIELLRLFSAQNRNP